jgi:hypothetical protein
MTSMQRHASCASRPAYSPESMAARNPSNREPNHRVWLASIQSEAIVRRSTCGGAPAPTAAGPVETCSSSSSTVMAPRAPWTV